MKIFLLASLFIVGTVFTQDTVEIDGTTYLFANDAIAADWPTANTYCLDRNMTMVGLETDTEYDSVVGWLRTNRKMNYWWTNGNNIAGTSNWQWGTQGPAFDDKNKNWGPQEPGNDAVQWQYEHVAIRVLDALYYSQLDVNTNHAMCQQ